MLGCVLLCWRDFDHEEHEVHEESEKYLLHVLHALYGGTIVKSSASGMVALVLLGSVYVMKV